MSDIPLETCWSCNELWNNKFRYQVASCWLLLLNYNINLCYGLCVPLSCYFFCGFINSTVFGQLSSPASTFLYLSIISDSQTYSNKHRAFISDETVWQEQKSLASMLHLSSLHLYYTSPADISVSNWVDVLQKIPPPSPPPHPPTIHLSSHRWSLFKAYTTPLNVTPLFTIAFYIIICTLF